jgi:hypothetical protein
MGTTIPRSPFIYSGLHDTKTHIRVLTGDKYSRYELESGKPKGFVAHDALHDACLEVLKIQELYRKFFT